MRIPLLFFILAFPNFRLNIDKSTDSLLYLKLINDSKDQFKISHRLSVQDPALTLQYPGIKQIFIIIAHRKGYSEHACHFYFSGILCLACDL